MRKWALILLDAFDGLRKLGSAYIRILVLILHLASLSYWERSQKVAKYLIDGRLKHVACMWLA